jgi:hypothetical protein
MRQILKVLCIITLGCGLTQKMYLPESLSRIWVYSERIGRRLSASPRIRGTKNRKYFQNHLQNDLNLAEISVTRQLKPLSSP